MSRVPIPQSEPEWYHMHVYFSDETADAAYILHERAKKQAAVHAVGRFHFEPVGPHPVRQFQLLVAPQKVPVVERWLNENRGELDVLIHPDIDDDLLAHTTLARWLGNAHALNLGRFKSRQQSQ